MEASASAVQIYNLTLSVFHILEKVKYIRRVDFDRLKAGDCSEYERIFEFMITKFSIPVTDKFHKSGIIQTKSTILSPLDTTMKIITDIYALSCPFSKTTFRQSGNGYFKLEILLQFIKETIKLHNIIVRQSRSL
eukprot:TRINITY_DN4896_c0_g1_i1.p1 TRINITY_DN4896_c0_g1~~TRINITY_DN4896_c0_g1_i1.p1  ORF type:complete len:135 (-),score=10.64 TRINITY_DN4896_c0_g1_i1:40-444(-)